MNVDDEKESFIDKYRYFFQDYSFNLEGMKNETRIKFESILKSLGAEISHHADYTLIDHIYFEKVQDLNRTDFYSLNFIVDSLESKRLMPINNYRLDRKGKDFCCLTAKLILKTSSCTKYYNNYVCCDICKEKTQKKSFKHLSTSETKINETDNSKENSKLNISTEKNNNKSNKLNSILKWKKSEKEPDQAEKINKTIKVESDSDEDVIENIRNLSVNSSREIQTIYSSDSESDKNSSVRSYKRIHQIYSSDSESDKNSSVRSYKRIHQIYSSDSDSDVRSNVRKTSKKLKTKRREAESLRETSSSSAIETDDCVEIEELLWVEYDRSKEWWLELPSPQIVEKMMYELKMDTSDKKKRGKTFHIVEMKLMISYLIEKNQIKKGKGIQTWINMIEEGYLNHRTEESLRNNFRRVILPDLKRFKLPNNYREEFSRLNQEAIKKRYF